MDSITVFLLICLASYHSFCLLFPASFPWSLEGLSSHYLLSLLHSPLLILLPLLLVPLSSCILLVNLWKSFSSFHILIFAVFPNLVLISFILVPIPFILYPFSQLFKVFFSFDIKFSAVFGYLSWSLISLFYSFA